MKTFQERYLKSSWLKIIVLIVCLAIIVLLSRTHASPKIQSSTDSLENELIFPTQQDIKKSITLTIAGKRIQTVVADTTNKRTIGLSLYESLGAKEGMLFVFEEMGHYPFWMRNMSFPIDLLWINEDKEIVFIKQSAQPEDFPESYKPGVKALYVLELVDGFVADHAVSVGDTADW